jgi:hypothetical protein
MSSVDYEGYSLEFALESVGPGWANLVKEVFSSKERFGNPVKIIQVKEKFGGLRIYTDYVHNELDEVIREVEDKSYRTCETCGSPGAPRKAGWIYTACNEHADHPPF